MYKQVQAVIGFMLFRTSAPLHFGEKCSSFYSTTHYVTYEIKILHENIQQAHRIQWILEDQTNGSIFLGS